MSDNIILNKLELIEKKITKMEKEIDEIRNGIIRNDANITLMTRLYFILRNPIIKLLKITGNNDKELLYNNEERTKYLK